MSFRLSKKVTLEAGDQVRVSGGPFYITEAGKKISMGEKGIGRFEKSADNGEALWIRFPSCGARFVYIGPEKVSKATGIIYKAHSIVKLRKQN
jgi:hypothetical protein